MSGGGGWRWRERQTRNERILPATVGDQRDYRVQGVVQTGQLPLAPHRPPQPSFLHPHIQHVVTEALLQLEGPMAARRS